MSFGGSSKVNPLYESDASDDDHADLERILSSFPRVVALHDYVARSPAELSFTKGDLLIVVGELDSNWIQGVPIAMPSSSPKAIALSYVQHNPTWKDGSGDPRVDALYDLMDTDGDGEFLLQKTNDMHAISSRKLKK